MLSLETSKICNAIINEYIADNKKITPVPGSMLADLVTNSIPVLPENISNIDDEGIAFMLQSATYSDLEKTSVHSELMHNYVTTLSDAVLNHIKVAKEVVLPIVKDLTKEVNEFHTGLNLIDAMNDINIIMYKKPILADNSSILDMVENYQGADLYAPSFISIGPKSKEEVMLLCTTGSNSLDNEILSYLSGLNGNEVIDTYNLLFNYKNSDLPVDTINSSNPFEKFMMALIGFLAARRLFDNPPEDIGMDLASYQSVIAGIRDYCGAMLLIAIEDMDKSIRNEVLILNLDRAKKVIKVSDVIYKKWLETNTEEAILGALVSERSYSTLTLITEKKDQLVEQWNNYKTYYTLRKEKDKSRQIKDFLANELFSGINPEKFTEIEQEYVKTNPGYVEQAKKNISEMINRLNSLDLENLAQLCLKLVARERFYFTSSYDILNGMLEVERINPDMNPREAALISVIYYITDFFVNQLRVEKINGAINGV